MPISKNAWIRYQALDRCFGSRVKKYYIGDLIEACTADLEEHGLGKTSISRRQVLEDIKYMESDRGWKIPLERIKEGREVYFRYTSRHFTISNRPLNKQEGDQLRQVLKFLARFRGFPQFAWLEETAARLQGEMGLNPGTAQVVAFQENQELQGSAHIAPLMDAILEQRVLHIGYRSFKQESENRFPFHPQLLKQFNNRWFLLGFQEDREGITNLALDRITTLEEAPEIAYRASGMDWETYFDDVVGVTIPDGPLEHIRIRVDANTWPYIHTKPLHHSQKKKGTNEAGTEVELHVRVNHELIAKLLQFGPGVQVLEPENVRLQVAEKVRQMAMLYGLVAGSKNNTAKP